MTDIIKYARNSSISGEQRQISPIPGLTRHFWTDAESFPSREISPIQGVKEEENGEKEETEDDEKGDLFIAETEKYVYC